MESVGLRSQDFRSVYRLIGECRELGDDPHVWRRHLFAGVGRLIAADIVGGGEMAGGHSGEPRILGNVDWGWEAGFNRQGWLNSIDFFHDNPFHQPALKAALERLRVRQAFTLPRPQLAGDDDWYRARTFEAINIVAGIDALMYSFRHVPGTDDDFSVIMPNRAAGRPNFNERERRVLAFLHRELAGLIGGPLARFTEPSPLELAPRVRHVLRCLLEGDGDKQIAARLNLSGHTVNQYTKSIFRHFGVSGRTELLARWVRRGWTARCEWLGANEDVIHSRDGVAQVLKPK